MNPRPGDLDLPFERQQHTHIAMPEAQVSGGLIVMSAVVDVPGTGKTPALVYRFAKPDGTGFYPPMLLVVAEDGMTKLAQLVASATAAAIAEASS